jgi:AcrR family transcriptional regulator
MQRPDEKKRKQIVAAAVRLFAARPFHEVRLEDVAAAARVGKGTVYIYFDSKEELYASLVREAFVALVDGLSEQLAAPLNGKANGRGAGGSSWDTLRSIVRQVVEFSTDNPHFFRLMRAGLPGHEDRELIAKRQQLGTMLESCIRRGIRRGEMSDPHPELTAQFIPSFVRAAALWGPGGTSPDVLTNHILRLLEQGLASKRQAS